MVNYWAILFNIVTMKKILLLLTLSCCIGYNTFAQSSEDFHPCGTPAIKTDWLKKYQANRTAYPKTDVTYYIPVTIHIVGKETETGYFSVESVLAAFCTLNQDFAPADIQFYIEGDFNYINNNDYYEYSNFSTGNLMMDENDVPNTINSYIVLNPAGTCGYNYPGSGRVALNKGCLLPDDHTWAHEIGHDFSLPHTFFGWEYYDGAVNYYEAAPATLDGSFEVEKVDGSNGYTSADGFSDTPADYLAFRWGCDDDNRSTQTQLDPDTVQFVSDGSFFMSYAGDNCMSRFSDEQTTAMRANIESERQNLLYNQEPQPQLEVSDLIPISPLQDEVVPFFDEVTLEWEPIEGATHYFVEITPNAQFTFVLYKFIVDANSLTTTDLRRNRTYYWRISPFNKQYTCTEASSIFSFMTNDVTDIPIVEGLLNFNVMPNPISNGQELNLHFGMEKSLDLAINLYSMTGQLLRSENFDAKTGNNRFTWRDLNYPPGMYFIGIEHHTGKHFEKIVIH